jgi:uncharacterized protein (TIGR03067 family)
MEGIMRFALLTTVLFLLACNAHADPPAELELPNLDGVWLLESSPNWQSNCNRSTLTISGDSFQFRGFRNSDLDWTGFITLAADKDSTHFELKTDLFQPDKKTPWLKYPAAQDVPGIFELKGNRLRICFSNTDHGKRPESLDQVAGVTAATFVRADPNFESFPDDVRVTVLDPVGKPVAGAKLFEFTSYAYPSIQKNGGWYSDTTKPMTQNFADCGTTGADGTITLKYDEFTKDMGPSVPCGAHLTEKEWIGFANVSPATLCHGSLTIQLQPQRIVRAKLQREVTLSSSWCVAYLTVFGNRVGFCEAPKGEIQFPVPPGDYDIYAYGADVQPNRFMQHVPPGDGDFVLPPIDLKATVIASLVGKPPPALDKAIAWKNGPVQLSDFKGRVVLLYFWNLKNDPAQIAELIALQDKFKDKGLQVIGVHSDPAGTINSVQRFDAKTKRYLDGIWDHDIQFPVALYFSKMHQPDLAREIWGITQLPASIVIDRKGNVAKFTERAGGNLELDLSKESEADATIAKLLNEP